MPKDLSPKYYEKNKEMIQKKSCERYQNKKEKRKTKKKKIKKKKRTEYGHKYNKTLSENEKQILAEYRKTYHEVKKK